MWLKNIGVATAVFAFAQGCMAGGGEAAGEDEEAEADVEEIESAAATTKCANGQTLGTMQGRVTKYCKQTLLKACGVGLTCAETSRRTQALANCVQARSDVIKLCFDGKNGRGNADQAHLNQLRFRTEQLSSCLNWEDAMVLSGRCVRLPGGRTTEK